MMYFTAEQKALAATDERSARAQARASHQGRKLRYEGTRWACPMCEAQCEIRTSQTLTKTMRETMYQCTNVECGCTFVVTAEIGRLLNIGATPNLAVSIPLSTHVRRDMLRAVLDNASESEHQARYTLPVTGDMFASMGAGDTS